MENARREPWIPPWGLARPVRQRLRRAPRRGLVSAARAMLVAALLHAVAGLGPGRSPPLARAARAETRGMVSVAREPLPLLDPGLCPTESATSPTWNAPLLIGRPRVAQGDVDAAGAMVRKMATMFPLLIAAQVERAPQGWRLAQVGVGFLHDVDGREVVVRSETAEEQGLSLDFLAQRVLQENEASCGQCLQVARTDTMIVFDAQALVEYDSRHYDLTIRHAALVEPRSGATGTCVWLVSQRDGRATVVLDQPQWLSAPFEEDRQLHVDADEFTLGIPSSKAFALAGLPEGETLPFDETLLELAARPFDAEPDVLELERRLRALPPVFAPANESR